MNILEEFERLKAIVATEEGWREVEDTWMIASNYHKRDGHWYKNGASAGSAILGFAIDFETREYMTSTASRGHIQSLFDLIEHLEEKHGIMLEPEDSRLIRGHLANVDGWNYPWIFLQGWNDGKIDTLETFLLEKEIGIPIRGLFDIRKDPEGHTRIPK